jgi:hypothetical protein
MKLIKLASALVLACCATLVFGAGVPAKVGDFALLDHQGTHHQLSYYGDHQAVVIFIHGSDDPAVSTAMPALLEIRDEYADQAVKFFMLNPQPEDDRDGIARDAREQGHGLPILLDEAQLVAASLGAQRTAEVFVINPKSMTVIYRGPADGSLKAALSGQDMAATAASVSGSPIHYVQLGETQAGQISYSKDIAPMLEENCVSCHHDGGIGPWAMSSHTMVQGWSKMMREVVMTRRMPPGQIDSHVSLPLQEEGGLSSEEKQLLVQWINAGAGKAANEEDPLAAKTYSDPRYTLGEPDMIVKVPAQTIPATGVIDYRYIPVELNLDKDVWVRAMETVPGDRQVLHHVIAYVSSPADKTVKGRATGAANGESLGGFAPGRQPDIFRDDSGRLLRKGSSLLLQMHYTTSGKVAVDETEIGLYLYDEPPTYVMAGAVAGQRRFLIPPNTQEHKLEGEQLVERDAYLYSLMPHMHYRGKYMNYTAIYPDGTSQMLLSVPRYEFNWQFNYQLEEPLFLPAGTRLVARGAMDNSDRNLANPDPSKPVHFGLQTKHEMFFGFITLRYVGDTPSQQVAKR